MLKGKKILVTSGGTQEYIDDVRVLTNISSGKLGWEIADRLMRENIKSAPSLETYLRGRWKSVDIYYLHGRNAFIEDGRKHILKADIEVRSAQDAYDAMEKLVPKMDAVIHCMAVSDFTFKRNKAIKCKSSDPEAFIEFMRQTITKNPKIIGKVKEWNPKTKLIGFKFEVGINWDNLMALAEKSIESNGCDLVVANDKKEMEQAKEHIAHFVFSPAYQPQGFNYKKVAGKMEIAKEIVSFLENVLD